MGLSASQARYLALVARQSNLEYQGQQINQERTILSQQCTELYNHLLSLQVPVPPSTNDFTKVEYSGADNAVQFTIGNIVPTGSTYRVEMQYQKVGHYLNEIGTVAVSGNSIDGYKVADEDYYRLSDVAEGGSGISAKHTISAKTMTDYLQAIRDTYPEYSDPEKTTDTELKSLFGVYFTKSSSGVYSPHFVEVKDVESGLDSEGEVKRYIKAMDYTPNGTYTSSETQEDCLLTFDAAGRITEIKVPVSRSEDGTPTSYKTIKLEAKTVTDNAAYQEAMAEYEYNQLLYDKQQQEINRKTEIIQQEDRNLELKLTRLDNERKQITTEIEAVDKVISDNIEKSYKTFNG